MGTMNTTARISLRSTPLDGPADAAGEQLTLLPTTSTPARFRLSQDTRERGLRHVAEIRQMLAARAERATSDVVTPRHDRAA
jgi:hypothetical protein